MKLDRSRETFLAARRAYLGAEGATSRVGPSDILETASCIEHHASVIRKGATVVSAGVSGVQGGACLIRDRARGQPTAHERRLGLLDETLEADEVPSGRYDSSHRAE